MSRIPKPHLLTTLILALLLTATTAFSGSLPNTPEFDQTISLDVNTNVPLTLTLDLLGRAAGITIVQKDVPADTPVQHNLASPRSFRSTWDLLTKLHDLESVYTDGVLIVGPIGTLGSFTPPPAPPEPEPETPTPAEYELMVKNTNEVHSVLEQRYPNIPSVALPEVNLIVVTALDTEMPGIRQFVEHADNTITLNAPQPRPQPVQITKIIKTSGNPEETTALLQQTFPQAHINVAPGNKAISVTATEETITSITAHLEQLEELLAETKPTRATYRPSNADSSDLAPILTELLESSNYQGSVTTDQRTNSVIVTAPEEAQLLVAALIADLDQRERQVRVRVRVQEVTETFANNLGVNFTSDAGALSANIINNAINLIFNPSNFINAFNISATLEALETQSLSNNIDDAHLLLTNNKPGSLTSGGSIEIALQGEDGADFRTLEFGTILNIMPRITADDFITLDINLELSGYVGEVAHGFQLNKKNLKTSIQIEDGDVILLGGLLSDHHTESISGVPFLKDIPIIGSFFRTATNRHEKSELVIILEVEIL